MNEVYVENIVIGAGVSGLNEAYNLHSKGCDVVVLEALDTPGGMLQSKRENGFLIELGANSLQSSPRLEKLVTELDLKSRVVEANHASRNRYVLRNQQLHAVPLSPFSLIGCSLISPIEKLRLLLEPFKSKMIGDVSVADFFSHRIGKSLTQVMVDAFVSGVWAGDISKLSMKLAFPRVYQGVADHGSLIKYLRYVKKNSALKRIINFDEGLTVLVKGFVDALKGKVLFNQKVNHITRVQLSDGASGWQVHTEAGNWQCKALKLAVPVYELKRLLGQLPTDVFNILNNVPHAPIISVSLGFKRNQIAHSLDGFGMLFPRSEGKETLGVIFSSILFANRCNKDDVLLTALIGGRHNPEILRKSSAEVLHQIIDEIQPILKIEGHPIFSHEKRWEFGIPQYEVGCQHSQEAFQIAIEQYYPQVKICSNYIGGVAISDRLSQT